MQKELAKDFSLLRLPAIQIDLVHVSNVTLPKYTDIYPSQTIPQFAEHLDSNELDRDSGTGKEKRDPIRPLKDGPTYKINYEFVNNVFQRGVNRGIDQIRETKTFPYEMDKM